MPLVDAPPRWVEQRSGEQVGHTRAMATDIVVRAPLGPRTAPPDEVRAAVDAALGVFGLVQATCTRFDPASPLMAAHARPDTWQAVPPMLFDALQEAHGAHLRTGGVFDPRVLGDLVALGYDRSLPFEGGDVARSATAGNRSRPRSGLPWRPRFRPSSHEVHLDGTPVELGGIGKGLSVRWAAEILRLATPDFLIEAGGDCYCAGLAPAGEEWRIGVEDPQRTPPAEPVAVVRLRDRACTTSSIRIRRWSVNGQQVHHLIDPRTGEPGGRGLLAVTVVGDDPAVDEVWSKTLFLAGADGIAGEAAGSGLPALWVAEDGRLGYTDELRPYLIWQRA